MNGRSLDRLQVELQQRIGNCNRPALPSGTAGRDCVLACRSFSSAGWAPRCRP
jgi:hypothetical protein